MAKNIYLSWSGGKDSSLALYEIRKAGHYNVVALLTTITEDYNRISMHGVRVALLEQQAESLGLPLKKVLIPKEASNEIYEARMRALLEAGLQEGIDTVAFGDIFLEDLKIYREKNLAQLGMNGLFPIWKRDRRNWRKLSSTWIQGRARLYRYPTPRSVVRRQDIRSSLLRDLPSNVDPCGENGEFHSFAYAGPIFQHPIPHTIGEVVRRDRYVFCDLVPN